MVQSETFVSRRKKRAERRAPRKLFTARGLVGGETEDANTLSLSRYSKEIDSALSDEPKANMSKEQRVCLNNEMMRQNHEVITRCDEIRDQSSYPNSYESDDDEFSRSSSLGNSLDEVMQMGCMDSLFFSGVMNKSRSSIFPLQHGKRSVEAFMTLPLPRLSFMKHDEAQSSYFQSNETSIRSRLDCHLPYQHITDQVAEARLLTTIRGQFFGFDRRPNRTTRGISYTMEGEKMGHYERTPPTIYRRHVDCPVLPIESPPSQIFIGEQPCLSDELIPVDDVPAPGVQCNLTKYHPKPLTIRQNYAFGKPMLSVDSEESDPTSEVSGKKNMSERNNSHSATTVEDDENVGTSPFDDRSYPSFDETDPCSVDRGGNEIKSASFLMALDPEVGGRTIRIGLAPNVDAKNFATTTSEVTGGGSLAGSAATDQAITSEIPKKMSISLETVEFGETECSHNLLSGGAECKKETLLQQAVPNPLLSKTKSASMASSIDDDNVSNILIQDENNSPPHISLGVKSTSPGMVNKYEQPSVAHPQKSISIGSHPRGLQNPPYQVPSLAEIRRRPFEVMVAANLPNSPGNYVEDEFFSPKANSPKHRNNSRTNDARLFRFEDSFDESEFFDTMA